MPRFTVVIGTIAIVLVLATAVFAYRALQADLEKAAAAPPAIEASKASHPAAASNQGFLHGRVTAVDGSKYEGRLRFGNEEEACWGDYFNGARKENTWAKLVPAERLPKERDGFEILGLEFAGDEKTRELGRLFLARFGDITRIEPHGRDVRVTLKSGTVVDVDRFEASDFDDGLQVWDLAAGETQLDSSQIAKIEFLPATPSTQAAPYRLYGTVHTKRGDFTGFLQWNRTECVGTDELEGRAAKDMQHVRFDTIRSIARASRDSAQVTLLDGREIVLTGTQEVGEHNRGVYVDDPRYGRVLVNWQAFERVDFGAGGSGPAYDDFPPGSPLRGTVTSRQGGTIAGRLVFDLDESETVETLDAPADGIDFTIPFGLVASIAVAGDGQPTRVSLRSGEELGLERAGDLGQQNLGILVYRDGAQQPEYLPWNDVARIDFERPAAMFPPLGE
jgi:hypothetical protein